MSFNIFLFLRSDKKRIEQSFEKKWIVEVWNKSTKTNEYLRTFTFDGLLSDVEIEKGHTARLIPVMTFRAAARVTTEQIAKECAAYLKKKGATARAILK
jgi:hypothetical protein